MNKQELLDALNKELVGKELDTGCYSYWGVERKILGVVQNLLKSQGYDDGVIKLISVNKLNYSQNEFYIRYREHAFACVKYSKIKGDYNYGGHYHWLIKSFASVWEEDFDFDTKTAEIRKLIVRDNQRKHAEAETLYYIYKKLEHIVSRGGGNKSVGQIIDALYKQQYSLSTRFEKDATKDQKIVVLPKVLPDFAKSLDGLNEQVKELLDEACDKRCEWENADDLDGYEATYNKLRKSGIEYEDVVQELNDAEDLLNDIADATKNFELGGDEK